MEEDDDFEVDFDLDLVEMLRKEGIEEKNPILEHKAYISAIKDMVTEEEKKNKRGV